MGGEQHTGLMNQYQANHNPSSKGSDPNGLYRLGVVVALVALLFLFLWFWT